MLWTIFFTAGINDEGSLLDAAADCIRTSVSSTALRSWSRFRLIISCLSKSLIAISSSLLLLLVEGDDSDCSTIARAVLPFRIDYNMSMEYIQN